MGEETQLQQNDKLQFDCKTRMLEIAANGEHDDDDDGNAQEFIVLGPVTEESKAKILGDDDGLFNMKPLVTEHPVPIRSLTNDVFKTYYESARDINALTDDYSGSYSFLDHLRKHFWHELTWDYKTGSLAINNTKTKIGAYAVLNAIKAMKELGSADTACELVANMVVARLKELFY